MLVSFRDEDLSDITDQQMLSCFNTENLPHIMAAYIELTNANPERPHNMNVLITNLDNDRMLVYTEKGWKTRSKKESFTTFYEEREIGMGEWIELNGSRFKHAKKHFYNHIRRSKEENGYMENEIRHALYVLHDSKEMIMIKNKIKG